MKVLRSEGSERDGRHSINLYLSNRYETLSSDHGVPVEVPSLMEVVESASICTSLYSKSEVDSCLNVLAR